MAEATQAPTRPPQVTVEKAYMTDIQGRPHATYRGILDAATRVGLKGIDVEILQMPTEATKGEAICKAVVTMEDGRTFAEIGDACPTNVHNAMKGAVLRMAATRAKGRALRDAINIGEAIAEEVDGTAPPPPIASAQKGARPAGNGSKAGQGATQPAAPTPPAASPTTASGAAPNPAVWEKCVRALNSPDENKRATAAAWLNARIEAIGTDAVDKEMLAAEERIKAAEATAATAAAWLNTATVEDPFKG